MFAKSLTPKTLVPVLLATVALLVPALQGPLSTGGEAQAAQAGCRYADVMPRSSTTVGRAERATLCLLNRERRARGLHALKPSKTLDGSSRRYARKMVRQRFFGHVSPSGRKLVQRIRASNYLDRARSYFVGENLAWGSGSLATPRERVEGWMDSRGHRANILNRRFRHIGVGVSTGAPRSTRMEAATYVTHFGKRSRR